MSAAVGRDRDGGALLMKTRASLAMLLAPIAPPCFSSRGQWLEYVAAAAEAQKQRPRSDQSGPLAPHEAGLQPAFNLRWNFCGDCSEAHSMRQKKAGSCLPDWLDQFSDQGF